jgi:truncated hemoglobin YjbI
VKLQKSHVKLEEMNEDRVFSLIGEAGFTRLVAACYNQVYDDAILGPMYPRASAKALSNGCATL